MNVKRIAPPKFILVPAGTKRATCRGCALPVYPVVVDGRAETVDVRVIGGIEPTATSAGSGVKHVCPEAA